MNKNEKKEITKAAKDVLLGWVEDKESRKSKKEIPVSRKEQAVPIYEYRCANCKTHREIIQKYDDPAPLCEKCEKVFVKVVSKNSFRLKGRGWYNDGYSKGE